MKLTSRDVRTILLTFLKISGENSVTNGSPQMGWRYRVNSFLKVMYKKDDK